MKRRSFIAAAPLAVVPLAGCLGDDPAVEELHEENDSSSFDAEAGEEYDVTVAAGEDGVTAVIESGDEQHWDWELTEDEEITDTIEIPEDGEYVVSVEDGSAFITVE